MTTSVDLKKDLELTVKRALEEDIGSGDITAALIPAEQMAKAKVIARETAVICGKDWVDTVFRLVDSNVKVHWHVEDGALAKRLPRGNHHPQ